MVRYHQQPIHQQSIRLVDLDLVHRVSSVNNNIKRRLKYVKYDMHLNLEIVKILPFSSLDEIYINREDDVALIKQTINILTRKQI